MVTRNLFSMPRIGAWLPVILLAMSCIAWSQTPTAATVQTSYGFCTGHSSPPQTIYTSNVFSLPASARAGVRPAFLEYVKSRDSSVASVNCIQASSQQQAANAKQTIENSLQQQVQSSAATAHPLKLVETGWQYQASSTPVTQTATRTVTTTTTRRAVPAATPTTAARTTTTPAATPAAATPTITSTSTTSTSTTAPANGVSSIGKTVTDTGQNAKQSVTQSVQGIESSTTTTVTDTITSTSTAGQAAIQNKIKGWQDKMFHKSKQPATAAAPASSPSPANTAAAAPAAAPSATLVSASTTAATPAARPTIQDEGDGKTFVLTEPGQADSVEVTLVPGSKNAYLDSATGTKYIVMPDGSVKKIAHRK